jgi:hypothetical protein
MQINLGIPPPSHGSECLSSGVKLAPDFKAGVKSHLKNPREELI